MKLIPSALRIFSLLSYSTLAISKEVNDSGSKIEISSYPLNQINNNNNESRNLSDRVWKQRGGLLEPQDITLSSADPSCFRKSFKFDRTMSLSEDGTILAIGYEIFGDRACYYENGVIEVYEYDRDQQQWTLRGNIISDKGARPSLSADGSILVTGHYGAEWGAGAVSIFQYDDIAQDWVSTGQISNDIDDMKDASMWHFGYSVATSNDGQVIAVGHPGNAIDRMYYTGGGYYDPDSRGRFHIYRNTGDATWTRVGKEIEGRVDGGQLGSLISLSGDGLVVAVGSAEHIEVYELNGQDVWEQVGRNIDTDCFSKGYPISFPLKFALSYDGKNLAVTTKNERSGGNTYLTPFEVSVVFKFSPAYGGWDTINTNVDPRDTWLKASDGSFVTFNEVDENGKVSKAVFKYQGDDLASSANGRTIVEPEEVDGKEFAVFKVSDYVLINSPSPTSAPDQNPSKGKGSKSKGSKGKGSKGKGSKSHSYKSTKQPKSHKKSSKQPKSHKKSSKQPKSHEKSYKQPKSHKKSSYSKKSGKKTTK
jgi:hypothetical protein